MRVYVRVCCCILISKVIFMHYCTGTLNFYRNYQMEVHVKTVWDSWIGRQLIFNLQLPGSKSA